LGAFHVFAQPLDVLPMLAAAGFVACLLYERTGSLWPPIAIHTFTNASWFEYRVLDSADLLTLVCFSLLAVLFLLAP
jgi:membrane protease YdiL (CAAX protease family)